MLISIVIPTCERPQLLRQVVEALAAQREAPRSEVIVVNDGRSPVEVRGVTILDSRGSGPAAARNLGVSAARGEIVAFLGDDTIPDPDWLARHGAAHSAGDVAVLGHTDWHPRLRAGLFLRWLNEDGKQFGYGLIRDPQRVPFNFFYSSNLSLRREHLLREPFCESFRDAAWEDIELGYRLVEKAGLRLIYEPGARALHDHPTDLDSFFRRQRCVGRSARIFAGLHPELKEWLRCTPGPLPPAWLVRGAEAVARRVPSRWLWQKLAHVHYARGVCE